MKIGMNFEERIAYFFTVFKQDVILYLLYENLKVKYSKLYEDNPVEWNKAVQRHIGKFTNNIAKKMNEKDEGCLPENEVELIQDTLLTAILDNE